MGLDEVGSNVKMSKIPQQFRRSRTCLFAVLEPPLPVGEEVGAGALAEPITKILVGSRVRQANPAEWIVLRAAVS